MERLLVKYADKVVEFEEKLKNKYKTDSIKLEVRSSVSWLGEELRVESEQGDYLTLFDDENGELSIDYYYVPDKNTKSYVIEVEEKAITQEKWKLDIIETGDGSFTYKDWRGFEMPHKFRDIESVIDYVIDEDRTAKLITFTDDEIEYDYKI